MEEQTAEKKMDPETKKFILQTVVVAATLLLVVMIIGLIVNLVTMVQLSNRREKLNAELKMLYADAQSRETDIEYRYTQDFIERYAREQLGMIDTGESTYIFAE